MIPDDGLDVVLDAIVAALFEPRTHPRAIRLGPGVDASMWSSPDGDLGPGTPTSERDLTQVIRAGEAKIVVLHRVSAAVRRALVEHPPPLIILGDHEHATGDLTVGGLVVGPRARVVLGKSDAEIVWCATTAAELEGCLAESPPDEVCLAISPTPEWFPTLLTRSPLRDRAVAGFVDATTLGARHAPAWISWTRTHAPPFVVIPLGYALPGPRSAWSSDALATGAVVQALEAVTGPVFPSARVLTRVLAGLRAPQIAPEAATETPLSSRALHIWVQARRALPANVSRTPATAPVDDPSPADAFLADRALTRARETRAVLNETWDVAIDLADDEALERSHEVLRNAGEVLTDQESKVVLRGFGFDVTRQAVANSASGAAGFADRIGYPVVLKALSPDLRRRSDVGGILLGLTTAAAVRRAFGEIMHNVEQLAPTARIDGVLVAEMLPDGADVRCGAHRLSETAWVLYGSLLGASDTVEPLLSWGPLDTRDALTLSLAVLATRRAHALRRESDPDIQSLAEVFLRLSRVLEVLGPRLESIDLGPIRQCPDRGFVVLDARVVQQAHLQGV